MSEPKRSARTERIGELVRKGLDDSTIAERVGMSRKSVNDARRRLGLAANGQSA